jgi:hypothetical protein
MKLLICEFDVRICIGMLLSGAFPFSMSSLYFYIRFVVEIAPMHNTIIVMSSVQTTINGARGPKAVLVSEAQRSALRVGELNPQVRSPAVYLLADLASIIRSGHISYAVPFNRR